MLVEDLFLANIEDEEYIHLLSRNPDIPFDDLVLVEDSKIIPVTFNKNSHGDVYIFNTKTRKPIRVEKNDLNNRVFGDIEVAQIIGPKIKKEEK